MIELAPAAFPGLIDAVKILAVVGAAVAGFLLGAPVARLLVRLAFHRPTPRSVQFLSRLGGAALLGYLVWLLPFGPGGWGSGPGGGPGKGPGPGARTAPGTSRDRQAADRKAPESSRQITLSVRVLGGNEVKDNRYYEVVWKGKKAAVTEAELEKILREDYQDDKRIRDVEIHMDENSVLETNPAVTDLVNLCKKYIPAVRIIKEK